MSLSIIIPVRPPGEGKSRLAPALAPAARAMLVERMFRHVLHVATQVTAQCYVVSRSAFLRDLAVAAGAHAVAETGIGLNKALAEASALVDPDLPVLALSADLPLLTPADLTFYRHAGLDPASRAKGAVAWGSGCRVEPGMTMSGEQQSIRDTADVIAATDRAGTGTNALLLRRPGLIDYAFGEGSLARHRANAAAAGLSFAVMRRAGLSADLDQPGDLALLDRPWFSAA